MYLIVSLVALALLALWYALVLKAAVQTGRVLRRQPYMRTRSQQLSYRFVAQQVCGAVWSESNPVGHGCHATSAPLWRSDTPDHDMTTPPQHTGLPHPRLQAGGPGARDSPPGKTCGHTPGGHPQPLARAAGHRLGATAPVGQLLPVGTCECRDNSSHSVTDRQLAEQAERFFPSSHLPTTTTRDTPTHTQPRGGRAALHLAHLSADRLRLPPRQALVHLPKRRRR